MFFDQICLTQTKPGQKLVRLVVERRNKEYYSYVFNEDLNDYEKVLVGRGWEIVREVNTTELGAMLYQSWTDSQKQAFLENLR